MNKKQLKGMIKELVRESLLEIFAEMKLESIVENVVNKKNISSRPKQTQIREEKSVTMARSNGYQDILNKIKDEGDMWADAYSGVENNSVLKEQKTTGPGAPDMTEKVSENQLAMLGLNKDYSDLI